MSHEVLRLHVVVQRLGVPDTCFVWPCPLAGKPIISQLLAQINDVVPLESGEWGLEDYVVELVSAHDGTFECLHFQPVHQVLKDEDTVIIRSLLGDDLKRRRLSGRHQISSDGKHLVDGLAFGRPWLRTPRDRPAVDLPPRKRLRTALGHRADADDDVDGDEQRMPQLLLEAPTDDDDESFADEEVNDDDDEEEDYVGGDDEAIDEELELLRQDNAIVGHEHPTWALDEGPSKEDSSAPSGSASSDDEMPDKRVGDSAGVDSVCTSLLRDSCELDALIAAFPSTPVSGIATEFLLQSKNVINTYQSLKRSNKPALGLDKILEMLFSPSLHPPPAPRQEAASAGKDRPLIQVVESTEATTSSGSKTGADSDGSDKFHDFDESKGDDDGDGDDSSDDSSDDSEESDDSSSDDSEASEDSQGGGSGSSREDGANGDGLCGSKDDRGTSSSDDGGDDGGDDSSDAEGGNGVPLGQRQQRGALRMATEAPNAPAESSPYTGLSSTQKRNARRRRLKHWAKQQGSGCETPDSLASERSLQERKEQLLRTLAQGADAAEETQEDRQVATGDAAEAETEVAAEAVPEQRRSRMDVGAGRRLLFGALGLRAPRTKTDEDRIKEHLMKDVRPLNNVRLDEEATEATETSGNDADMDEWRDKVVYGAVECCQDGIVLSEPPFPFQQRWDPQQQGRRAGRGKRKRSSQAFDEEFYDDDSAILVEDGEQQGPGKRRQSAPSPFGGEREPDEDETPALPADLSVLAALEAGAAKEGMVITWKQMTLSKATNWQPELTQKTGTVLSGGDDDALQVLLAARDRDVRERLYDEETGRRVYGKFEVPDSDGEGEDDGHRVVAWAELGDARVVREAPAAAGG
ncbi:hypothetical protein DCS_05994 [Drechmeria coniospora]|uniref:DUF7357 domain-containing protein n=1 Tax=Drechmeria coniospora TaxID=98403 RepID=A0A151GAC8_DRECN|nr:hypothetical protein DCS_05994 [Drechmeria coniospora]KYK54040.1 hypothetical protein DCS_05994 [Drechmeria coniospora]ODA78906.1 hypothetical protein RJ55_04496 [Drechmeria coniospora]